MRIAYFSPLNPMPTGVSDYSEELLCALSERSEIDVFVDGYVPTNEALGKHVRVRDCSTFEDFVKWRRYDALLYQMGNSRFHRYIYDLLRRYPGVVTLHDVVLQHLLHETYLGQGDVPGYLREMAYCHDVTGLEAGRRLAQGEAGDLFRFPCFHRVVDLSTALIVHNEYAARVVRQARPGADPIVVPQIVGTVPVLDRQAARAHLGLGTNALVVGSFGHMTPSKRLDVALTAFSRLREQQPAAVFLLVGSVSPHYPLQETIANLGLQNSVRQVGYVSDIATFYEYIAATDVAINLRYPTAGETSAALLRLLAMGTATIVSDIDSFREIPDSCCLKAKPGPGEVDVVTAHLRLLAGEADLRRQLGEEAKRLIRAEHNASVVATRVLAVLRGPRRVARSLSVGEKVRMDVARTLTDLDLMGKEATTTEPQTGYGRLFAEAMRDLGIDSRQ